MKPVKVAVIGFGTIGTGVVRLLLESSGRIARAAGRPVELARIVDVDIARPRSVNVPDGLLVNDLNQVLNDPEIGVAVELIGGLEPARTIVLGLLEKGKDIVTANKALLAEHGAELCNRARKLGRSIAFEAAVAGGIPIIGALGCSLAANEIRSIRAILNGTSNFILTQMGDRQTDYCSSVAEAQRLGYAEADPTLDVNGSDAAQKLAILAQIAYGARVNWREIPRTGIDTVDVADIRYARELGYTIKLLAVAEVNNGGLELHVCPTLVRNGTPLAEVREAFNAVEVVGDAVGRVFFHGLGAGQMPTASAVVGDVIDTVLGRAAVTFRTLGLWSDARPAVAPARDPDKIAGRYYLRLHVEDRPGVLAEIAGVLGKHQISIASVIQHEAEEPSDDVVPLVIMTHAAAEGAMRQALAVIDQLAVVRSSVVRMRVQD